MEAIIPSLEPAKGVLFIVGTLLSKRSVLAKCLANPEFISHVSRAIDEPIWDDERKEFSAGVPLWAARFSLQKLSSIRRLIGSISFNKEYQNDPRDDDGMFREEWIRRFKFSDLPNVPLYHYQGIDPSLKSGQSNDYKAHVTVAKGGPKYYCRHASITRSSIDQMVKSAYLLHARFQALQVGLETVGWQELLRRDFDREAQVQNRYLPIVPIERQGLSKESEARIGGLSPLVENGVLLFAEGPAAEVGDMEMLIEQLLYFPSSSVHDDGPDALEIAVHLAEKRASSKVEYETVASYTARFAEGTY
jgi:phage terminase large subunit-like protein